MENIKIVDNQFRKQLQKIFEDGLDSIIEACCLIQKKKVSNFLENLTNTGQLCLVELLVALSQKDDVILDETIKKICAHFGFDERRFLKTLKITMRKKQKRKEIKDCALLIGLIVLLLGLIICLLR